jgi:putative NADH-flavin reductase
MTHGRDTGEDQDERTMTTSMRSDWMLYGAYGSTGRLILDEAVRRGHRPLLAGRDAAQLAALGQTTGLTTLRLSLDDDVALREALSRVSSASRRGSASRPAADARSLTLAALSGRQRRD